MTSPAALSYFSRHDYPRLLIAYNPSVLGDEKSIVGFWGLLVGCGFSRDAHARIFVPLSVTLPSFTGPTRVQRTGT